MTSLLIYHDIISIPVACTTSRNLTVVYMPCFKSNPMIAHTGGNRVDRCLTDIWNTIHYKNKGPTCMFFPMLNLSFLLTSYACVITPLLTSTQLVAFLGRSQCFTMGVRHIMHVICKTTPKRNI